MADLTPPDDMAQFERLMDALMRMGHLHGTRRVLRRDGSTVSAAYHTYANVAPGVHVAFFTEPD